MWLRAFVMYAEDPVSSLAPQKVNKIKYKTKTEISNKNRKFLISIQKDT